MNPAYIETFDIKPPNSETSLVSSPAPPAKTKTSIKLPRELFGDDLVFSHVEIRCMWQPINTAPREPLDKHGYGPSIFLLRDGQPEVGFWDNDYSNFYIEGANNMNPQPSHWMAVPEVRNDS